MRPMDLNPNELLAEYWKTIKVGDSIDVGGNSRPTVTKKNAKSLETGTDCKWTAAEIIGRKGLMAMLSSGRVKGLVNNPGQRPMVFI